MQTLSTGSLLQHDTYRIEKVLGQGGFGITYLATDLNLQRKVAIKEFFPKDFCERDETTSHVTLGTRNTAEFVNRLKAKFLKEARNIAKFDHPNIIRIYAAFEENNTAYYVMEYIEGESLSLMVKRSGPLPEKRALDYIEKVGEALEYVHARNINHLDVKPANIMVRKSDDTPVLIDFGLSKQYDSEGNQTSTMPPGFSHGFAPMEQYNEGGVRGFSPQTDLYSLAATLYYILSGVVPIQATRRNDEELTFPNSIPQKLIAPISKAMSPGRKGRHKDVSEFIKDLEDADKVTGRTAAAGNTMIESETEIQIPARQEIAATDSNHKSASHREGQQESASSRIPNTSKTKLGFKSRLNKKWYILGGCAATVIILVILLLKEPSATDISVPSINTKEETSEAVASPALKTVEGIYYKSSLGACSYTGEVDEDGKPHGKGKAEWETGLGKSYDGDWVHGEMDGNCTYLSRKGYRFIGKFKDGHYSEGKLISPDKSYYEGTFDKKGKKWTGTEYDSNGIKTDTWKNGE